MTDFKVNFSVSGWLLLVIIPLLAITFFVYFRVKKKFRHSLNRDLSLVLHCVVLSLCVLMLSGIYFTYNTANERNELVILVDSSISSAGYKSRVDTLVHDILVENDGLSNISIITFGYDQQVALKMGKYDPEKAFERYVSAPLPDTTASDISSALTFVWDPETETSGGGGEAIIHYPETAKIFLISDGLQTDKDAMSVAGRIAMDGIQIDTSHYPAVFKDDVWITGVTYTERNYAVDENIDFEVAIRSSLVGEARLDLVDGESKASMSDINLVLGTQTIKFPYAFSTPGYHELKFVLTKDGDSIVENNTYYTYYEIKEYTSLLVLERYQGESEKFINEFRKSQSDGRTVIDVVNVVSGNVVSGKLPNRIEELTRYDEVVLVNIAHADLPKSFENLLEVYVKDYGGGMLTVGGLEHDSNGEVVMTENASGERVPKAHAYDEADLANTKLQEMLPVEATAYSPSVALAILIDISGSMSWGAGSGLEIAIAGAKNAINALSIRDQVGILTLADNYTVDMQMTPMTRKSDILNIINRLTDNAASGGTAYRPSIEMACHTLASIQSAEKKHILFISDSDSSDEYDEFNDIMNSYHKNSNINLTVITCKGRYSEASFHFDMMENFARDNGGTAHVAELKDTSSFAGWLSADLGTSDVTSGAVPHSYNPQINADTPVVNGLSQSDFDKIKLGGFFTNVAKSYGDVEVSLMAEYVPLYAQWNYGEGTVGSFMCDLDGYWSSRLLDSETGTKLIGNIVSGLIKKVTEIVEGDAFRIALIEDNYRTQVSIYGFDPESEKDSKLVAFVSGPIGSERQKFDLREGSVGGNRFTFENKIPGVYEVIVAKVSASFNMLNADAYSDIPPSQLGGSLMSYRAFSYSKEYDPSLSGGKELLINISTREVKEGEDSSTKLVYDAKDLLSYFTEIRITYNPQLLLCILAVVLMLLDIAIRKFRLKRLHDIIKTRRLRKAQFGE